MLRKSIAGFVAVVLIAGTTIPQAAMAETSASVFGVKSYDHATDLGWGPLAGNDDATWFANKLVGTASFPWTPVTTQYNADVTPSDFTNAKSDDVIYFTGHGSTNGSLALKAYAGNNAPVNSYVNWDTIGSSWKGWDNTDSEDFEIAIFAACNVLKKNSWANVLSYGGHHLLGYRDPSNENTDLSIIGSFYNKATGATGGAPIKIIDAWKYANTDYSEYDWAVTGHKNNENDYFYVSSGMTADQSGTSDIYHWYNGGGFYLSVSSLATSPLDSDESSKLKESVVLKKENIDIDRIAQNLMKMQSLKQKINRSNNSVYTDGASTLIEYPSGAINYYREMSEKPIGFSPDEALVQAGKFLKQNGGLPSDAQLSAVMPQITEDANTQQQVTNGYLLEYKRKIDGVTVDGYAGDSIKVMIDSEGINYFFRLWREIDRTTASKPMTQIVDFEKAKEAGEEYLKRNNKSNLMREFDSAELVYFSNSFFVEQSELTPAWKVTSGSDSAYVNAENGEIIDGDEFLDNMFEEINKNYEIGEVKFSE
ncbi:hypothetical protein [Paenibacillus sp. MMS18-CY102]|uniref:hypothetical protein n=1 Tax=Paenibacillus sp. MMS18-CY102 TaxID=2682849 RepID=UPI001366513B|nr:hypothetical protein [Paenibacillus sp. MMS18-CY102]MWC29658.1 hypothetical protein [Paenibacillus sp. MMS18-CY102]